MWYPDRVNRQPLQNIRWIVLTAVWACTLVIIAWFCVQHLPVSWHAITMPDYRLTNPLFRWDAVHYASIAQFGYRSVAESGFFPGYPLLLRTVHTILPLRWDWLGSVVSLVLFTAGLSFIRSLRVVQQKNLTPWVTAFALLLPLSFFFITPMSESLLWFATALLVWSLERKHFWIATIALSLAIVSRPAGLVLLIPFCAAGLYATWRWTVPIAIVSLVPLVLWDIHLHATLHTWTGPLASQFAPDHRGLGIPLRELIALPHNVRVATNHAYQFDALLLVAGIVMAVGALVGIRRILPRPWFWAGIVMLCVTYSSGTLWGTDRYVMTFAPFIVGIAAVGTRTMKRIFLMCSACMLLVATALFSLWYFIA